MKIQVFIFLLIGVLLSVSGCSKSGDDEYLYGPIVRIEYVDKTGKSLMQLVDIKEGATLPDSVFKLVSLTDKNGAPVEYPQAMMDDQGLIEIKISGLYGADSPKTTLEYHLKYKIPGVLGEERMEELKLLFKVATVDGGFTSVVYNNEIVNKIPVDPKSMSQDEIHKLLYNGKTNFYKYGPVAHIIIAVGK